VTELRFIVPVVISATILPTSLLDLVLDSDLDSQPKSTGLVWGLAATRRSVYIHQNDGAINIVVVTIIIITEETKPNTWFKLAQKHKYYC